MQAFELRSLLYINFFLNDKQYLFTIIFLVIFSRLKNYIYLLKCVNKKIELKLLTRSSQSTTKRDERTESHESVNLTAGLRDIRDRYIGQEKCKHTYTCIYERNVETKCRRMKTKTS